MKHDELTPVVVRILNERISALPLSRFSSRQRFLQEAAKCGGASPSQLRKILDGETPTIRLDHLYAITGALGANAALVLAEALAEVELGVTARPAEPATRSDESDIAGSVLSGEVSAKLDEMVNRLRPTRETGQTGASAENRS